MKRIIKFLTLLFIVAGMLFALVGCSFFNKDEPVEDQLPEDIVSDIEDIQTELQGSLQDVLNSAMSGDTEPNELLSETEYRNGFEVLSHSETETGVLVTFRVYSPDLYTVAKELDENYKFETEDELRVAVLNAIAEAEIIEKEVTIEFAETDKGYAPVLTMDFIDAYYGGVIRLFEESFVDVNKEAAE